MKKVLSLIVLMMSCAVSFAQEEQNDSIQKPSKFASWTISDAFQAEAGFAGSYWKPTFNIALDKEGYYCVVNLYNQSGYYSVDKETLPHLYLKTENGEVVDLEMDGDEPIHDEPIEQGHNSEANPLNVENFINDTRKRALQIMAKLAEDPENPIYDISKRIWQICDKAYNDQKEGNGLAQQQQIHQQQQHNNI